MNTGLSAAHREMIAAALEKSGALRALLFGSRAKGTWRASSDVDIAVFGDGCDLGELRFALDELPTPYKFDVVKYEEITNAALRDHIDRVGVEICRSQPDKRDKK